MVHCRDAIGGRGYNVKRSHAHARSVARRVNVPWASPYDITVRNDGQEGGLGYSRSQALRRHTHKIICTAQASCSQLVERDTEGPRGVYISKHVRVPRLIAEKPQIGHRVPTCLRQR